MPFDLLFRAANLLALLCWLALVLLPPWSLLRRWVLPGAVVAMCLLYTALVLLFFFRAQGGGFGSLQAVQRLFAFPPVALAGWVHYLAFDLGMGLWIAARADAMGVSRWVQAPILLTTFMVGPVGLLLFTAVRAAARDRHARTQMP